MREDGVASRRKAQRLRKTNRSNRSSASPPSRKARSSRKKSSPQGEASSQILGGSSHVHHLNTDLTSPLTTSPTRNAQDDLRMENFNDSSSRKDGKWVLWMALSETERVAGRGKLFTAKQLAWRKRRREQERERVRQEKLKKRAAARRSRKRKDRQKRGGKIKTTSLAQKNDNEVTESCEVAQSNDKKTEISVQSSSSVSNLPPIAPKQRVPDLGHSLPSDLRAHLASSTSPSMHFKHPQLLKPHARPRLQRISISRDASDKNYKEFRKLLFEQDEFRAKVFKEQFRGGNPYIKTKHKSSEESLQGAPESLSNEEQRVLQKLAGKIDREGNFHCQSRKCGAVVKFQNATDSFVECLQCSHLNNRKSFKHVDAPRAPTSPHKLLQTHAEMCRQKFMRKMQHRFIDQLNGVIQHIGDTVNAGRPPKKNIWKEFDNTQLRLQHPFRAPAAPGAKYNIEYGEGPSHRRTLSQTKSSPAFTLYAKRHQMRFDADPDSPER